MNLDTTGAAFDADATDKPDTTTNRRTPILAVLATVVALVTTMTAAATATAVTPTAVTPTDSVAAAGPSITLRVGVNDPSQVVAQADTIAAVLANRNISLGANDTISPRLSTAVQDGMTITIKRVSFVKAIKIKKIKKPKAKRITDATMKKGTKKVVKRGRAGKARVTIQKKIVNGQVVSATRIARKVVKKAKPKVVRVGTKNNNVNWDGIARCESGNRWHINTGNGYYGGLQFSYSTWLSNGGGKYAKYAHLATKQEQIDIANRLYASRGLQPWGCRAYG